MGAFKNIIVAFITLAVVTGSFSVAYAAEPLAPKATMADSVKAAGKNHVMVIAHRGTPRDNPEHSITGYHQAVSDGSIFLEADIVMSKDGVLYVTHDDNLKRTTGKNIFVSKSASKQLDKIKFSNGDKLLRLSELFDEFGKDAFYVLETKSDKLPPAKAREMDKKFVRLVEKYKMRKRVMLQSQSVASLKRIHSELKNISFMYISERDAKPDLPKAVKALPGFVDAVSISHTKASKRSVQAVRARKMKVALYTVDSKKDIEKAMRYKPDMLFTNDTKKLIKYLSAVPPSIRD
jgi:glycerophosphoryl diester phosphodiesterase